jgi:hypothetical protein
MVLIQDYQCDWKLLLFTSQGIINVPLRRKNYINSIGMQPGIMQKIAYAEYKLYHKVE